MRKNIYSDFGIRTIFQIEYLESNELLHVCQKTGSLEIL